MFDKVQESQSDAVQVNPFTMAIPTPTKTDYTNKRVISEMEDMEIDEEQSSSKRKKVDKGKYIIDLEEEEQSTN